MLFYCLVHQGYLPLVGFALNVEFPTEGAEKLFYRTPPISNTKYRQITVINEN